MTTRQKMMVFVFPLFLAPVAHSESVEKLVQQNTLVCDTADQGSIRRSFQLIADSAKTYALRYQPRSISYTAAPGEFELFPKACKSAGTGFIACEFFANNKRTSFVLNLTIVQTEQDEVEGRRFESFKFVPQSQPVGGAVAKYFCSLSRNI